MKEFIDLLLNDSVFFLIAVTIVVLIILIIICVILLKKKYDIVEVTERKDNTLNDNVNKLNTLVNEPTEIYAEEIKEDFKETLVENNVIEEKNNKMDLEAMLSKMEETLNEKDKAIANFELEQEEKAIISYEELKKAVNKNNNTSVTKVDSLEPKKEVSKKTEVVNNINDNKNFKNTDFISPIYGRMDNNYEYPTISNFEENAKEEPKENIIVGAKHSKSNNEAFLDNLKQFRRNLE